MSRKWKRISAWDIATRCKVLHYTEIIRLLRQKWLKIENVSKFAKDKHWETIKYSFYAIEPLEVVEVENGKVTIKPLKPQSIFEKVRERLRIF